MYIPISAERAVYPSHIHLERDSQWYISALQATAIESVTIPSRLRGLAGNRGAFQNLESALNSNGNQKIAKLQFGVVAPSSLNLQSARTVRKDARIPEQDLADTRGDGVHEANACLKTQDIEFLPGTQQSRNRQVRRAEHTFGQTEVLRGNWPPQALGLEEVDDSARVRRRFAGLPSVERSVLRDLWVQASET